MGAKKTPKVNAKPAIKPPILAITLLAIFRVYWFEILEDYRL